LVDAQLPPALAEWLRTMGHVAEHVRDLPLLEANDLAIRAFALRTSAVLVTKDRDFVAIVDPPSESIQVVWVRTGNVSNEELMERLHASWPALFEHLTAGVQLIELR
jgi:predicted nuclease of predicted toxin-antitoxin system